MRSSRGSRLLRGPPEVIFPNSLMSAPATKVRPPPITTDALTAGSPFISSIAAKTPSGTPGPRAFTGGLSMVMTATSLSLLTLTRLFIGLSSKFRSRITKKFSLPGRLASIDNQHVSRHVRRSVRCQKHGCPFQIVIAAKAAQRDLRQQGIFTVLDDPARHMRRKPSRGDGIHLDVVRRPLARQIPGERNHSALARVVADCLQFRRRSAQTRHRCHVDDLARPLRGHSLAHRLTKQERAGQVGGKNFVPLLQPCLPPKLP